MNAIYTQVYLDPHSKEYMEVFTVEPKPSEPLLSILIRVPYKELSPYKVNQLCRCMYVIKNINKEGNCHLPFLPTNDLPTLFSFLTLNGYEIDTKLTNMITKGKSNASLRNLVCYIRSPKKKD